MKCDIPKNIHYCWFGGKEIPVLSERCIETWKQHMPDYQFMLWTESNLPVRNDFIDFHLKKKNWAFVSDYIRLFVLYEYGGIYFDTDIEVVKSLSPLLNNEFFIGEESLGRPTTGVMGSISGHGLLKSMMNIMEENHSEKLPYLIAPEVCKLAVKRWDCARLTIYPPEYFYPYNPYDQQREKKQLMISDVTSNTYAVHHWAKGWNMNIFDKLRRFFNK